MSDWASFYSALTLLLATSGRDTTKWSSHVVIWAIKPASSCDMQLFNHLATFTPPHGLQTIGHISHSIYALGRCRNKCIKLSVEPLLRRVGLFVRSSCIVNSGIFRCVFLLLQGRHEIIVEAEFLFKVPRLERWYHSMCFLHIPVYLQGQTFHICRPAP